MNETDEERLTGVVYDFANNGREGVDRFLETHEQQLPYDCIFMDNQMAVLNGEQVRHTLISFSSPSTFTNVISHNTGHVRDKTS